MSTVKKRSLKDSFLQLESTEWEKSNYASTLLHHKADCMGPVIVDTLVNAVGCGTQNMPVPVLISTITKFHINLRHQKGSSYQNI